MTAERRLMREYHAIQKTPNPQVKVRPDPKSVFSWHYVLHDLPEDTPFSGGVYHGKLVFPENYPFAPPSIMMITPNGRFDINKRLCLSMSDFHPESWNPSWRIESILQGLLSFMLDPQEPRTTGAVICSAATKKTLAKNSFAANKKNVVFCSLFPEFLDESKWSPVNGFRLNPPGQAASSSSRPADAGRERGGARERAVSTRSTVDLNGEEERRSAGAGDDNAAFVDPEEVGGNGGGERRGVAAGPPPGAAAGAAAAAAGGPARDGRGRGARGMVRRCTDYLKQSPSVSVAIFVVTSVVVAPLLAHVLKRVAGATEVLRDAKVGSAVKEDALEDVRLGTAARGTIESQSAGLETGIVSRIGGKTESSSGNVETGWLPVVRTVTTG
uniref:UBC core domain-containing protein n=1 Tax=Chromera velia CCMP2878 TaxID=1169474 RepID=A0A0G4HW07_9ALVE|eukprot:Cvel_8946.t1-p1 / transcript=Cvel_8946.t1 / gene=Cvel_8946 / organism=Chromera_velia_CCMP2878 / gene_product=Ubiquitin-conjugating enzyme E2 J2, putative / transcript_product=Ubiquitin-conjugating enzyme E2 J2, putative / location=Cvel_scaffold504:14169-20077(+) / protein_length=384 / sequence_SO=supercontig / SO=protein_coding / is_pseudo=false